MASDPYEVRVNGSFAATVVADDQPGTTLTTEDRPLQVVMVLALLLSGSASRVERFLDLVPHLVSHECVVLSGIVNALVSDDGFVIRVPQQPTEIAQGQG